MCGLTGILLSGAPAERLAAWTLRATVRLAHRGPDGQGVWARPEGGVALGHRRLAVVDVSAAGAQPMISPCGRMVLALNGEVYNHAELRAALGADGAAFRGHSDTEVLLAAFLRWGVAGALERTVGMFAFALWDGARGRLHLGRDRMGEKPLYYGWMDGALVFGSELGSLAAYPCWRGEVDRGALALYLRLSYLPAPHCIFRGVRKLPPGCVLTVRADDPAARPEPWAYWRLRDAALAGMADPLPEPEAEGALEAALRRAIREQRRTDVPVGAFLSGGIDSSTVAALMAAEGESPLRTFTLAVADPAYDESAHAAAVARHLGAEHHVARLGPDEATAIIPRLARVWDEPFADASQIPTLALCAFARDRVTVCLSGDGGDELFAGYDRYGTVQRAWRGVRAIPPPLRPAAARVLGAVKGLPPAALAPLARWSGLGGTPREAVWRMAGVLGTASPEALGLWLSSEWRDPGAVVPGAEEPPTPLTRPERWTQQLDVLHRLLYADGAVYLPDDILAKVDRAAMAHGLEVRAPFLDHRVVELAWRIPGGAKWQGGSGKRVLRRVLHRLVPPALVERPKAGFGVPLDALLRGPLRGWADALLDGDRLRREGFLSPRPVCARWEEHLRDRGMNWGGPLWGVLMFQAWLEEAPLGPAPAAD